MRILFVGGGKDGAQEDVLPTSLIYGELGETYCIQRLTLAPKGGLVGIAYPQEWPYELAVQRLLEGYLVFPNLYARLLELRTTAHEIGVMAPVFDSLVELAEGDR